MERFLAEKIRYLRMTSVGKVALHTVSESSIEFREKVFLQFFIESFFF